MKTMHNAHVPVRNYLRGVDFNTGVATVRWEDDRGRFLRHTFISRPDNIAVLSIRGPGKGWVHCTLTLAQTPRAWGVKEARSTAEEAWLTYRTRFANVWPGSLQGCEGVSRVITKNGSRKVGAGKLFITGADEVLVMTRVELTYNFDVVGIEQLKQAVGSVAPDHDTLLKGHAKVHSEVLNRVPLNLGGDPADHALSSESLQAKSAVGNLSRALLEKEIGMQIQQALPNL